MSNYQTNQIKIGLVEDHPLFIEGLKNILLLARPVEVSFICHNKEELLSSKNACKEIDFLISDLNLNGEICIDEISQIKSVVPNLKIIALSMYQPWEIKLDLEHSIFNAYVLKNSGTKVLLDACKAVLKGNTYFDPNIEKSTAHINPINVLLTSREKEIVTFLKAGKQNKEIADLLFLSEFTIKTHRQNIMRKLEVRNVAELIKKFS
ncbi:MAG: response regulator transcription factor [Flavobacteriales bacterium]|jgi:two-component system, NarL family, response regulator NreC|nr:response regulator transcription factor [Flavobacteriales bacterium]MDP4717091.1 response regulator transcription factor [Flavobacteriales bacterium]MDP4731708.1 response regulator transcription factor [Flavobacteriales bacterium]MDP4819080.1 response regulator transcription factor [Flavobacteriales bacterium]MDP4951585.1 response regulator transcription factor [Flavobacteriales bacterium]